MSDLSITFDWTDFGSHDNPLIDGTFANLRIRCGQTAVIQVLDRKAQTIRDFITVPLYPIAEWIAANWWALLYECDSLGKGGTQESFASRHSLRTAQEGFVMPELKICSEGEDTLFTWNPVRSAHQNVEFIGRGSFRLPTADAAQQLESLVDAVLGRLSAKKLESPWLANEWSAIQNSDPDESEFCRASGFLGLDPYSMSQQVGNGIHEIWDTLPPGLRQDIFCASSGDTLRAVGTWVNSIGIHADAMRRWSGVFEPDVPANARAPWEIGYQLADDARRRFGLGVGDLVDLENIPDMKMRFIRADSPPIPSIEGLMCVRENNEALYYTARQRPESRRFLAARGLMGWLYGQPDVISLLSTTLDRRQQQQRAFAAEFLAPADAIRERITTRQTTEEQIIELAAHFQVSDFVILHQLKNHRIAETPV